MGNDDSDTGIFFQHGDDLIFRLTPTGYAVAVSVGGGEEAYISVRGLVPALIESLAQAYHTVTGKYPDMPMWTEVEEWSDD